jgi:hypothetical protein
MPAQAQPTRRQLLMRAAVLGGATVEIGSGALPQTAAAAPVPKTDAELVSGLLEIELLAEFALQTVILTGLLHGMARRVVQLVLQHERVHSELLSQELRRLGGSQPTAPADVSIADRQLAIHHVDRQLAGLTHEQDAIKLLIDIESACERVYYDAMSQLSDRTLLRTVAEIVCSEAQHYTALSLLVHKHEIYRTVPDAFVEGNHSV